MIEMPIHYYIVAMNQLQAKNFSRENEISPRDYTYIHSPTQLRGLKGNTLIVLYGWDRDMSPPFYDSFKRELAVVEKRASVIYMSEYDLITKELIWQHRVS